MKKITEKENVKELKDVKDSVGERKFDYKDVNTLSKYVSERGRIMPRSRSGLSAQEQRKLAIAVKRARILALMPFAD